MMMRVYIESTNTGRAESGSMEYNTTDSQYYTASNSAESNNTYSQNEEDADYEEYYTTSNSSVLVTAPYKWHESCFCRNTFKDWFPEEFGASFFCKIACDADLRCKGFLSVGNHGVIGSGCALATTSLCPDGCTKYFEGNRGNIIKDIPFSRFVSGKYFRGDRLGGCFFKNG